MTRYPPEAQAREAEPDVITGFLRACVEFEATSYERLALFEAGIVESNLTNMAGGDRDSVGPLQQRPGGDWARTAKDRRDPHKAALAFLKVARRMKRPSLATPGALAQAVQRSAYPGRYDEAEQAALFIIARATGGEPMAWHLAPSLKALMTEVDARWPKRDRSSDGALGDTSHAARESEHNPDHDSDSMPTGAVSAVDITKDSVAQMDAIRKALVADDRVWYVIHSGRIYSRTYDFKSRPYSGANAHTKHLHVSLRQTRAAHDDTSSWGIASGTDEPAETPSTPGAKPTEPVKVPPTLKRGANPNAALVATLQRFLGVREAGFAERTYQNVRRYQGTHGLKVDGVVGPKTWAEILKALKLPGYND